jgi:hypothetical protein
MVSTMPEPSLRSGVRPIVAAAVPGEPSTAPAYAPAAVGPYPAAPPDGPVGRFPSPARIDRQTNRAIGWVAVAIGGEAAAVALVTSGLMLHQNAVRSDGCDPQHVCSQAGIDANTQLSQLAPWNTAAYLVAAAGLGVGVYLLLTNPPDRAHTEVGVVPGGVRLAGSF